MHAGKCWDCGETAVGQCQLCQVFYCGRHGGEHGLCHSCASRVRRALPGGVIATAVASFCVAAMGIALGVSGLSGDYLLLPKELSAVLLVFFGLLPAAVGLGLLDKREWARKAAVIMTAPWALAVPVGTFAAIGIIGYLISDDVKLSFRVGRPRSRRRSPHDLRMHFEREVISLTQRVEEAVTKHGRSRQFEVYFFAPVDYDGEFGWDWWLWKKDHRYTYHFVTLLDVDSMTILRDRSLPAIGYGYAVRRHTYEGFRRMPNHIDWSKVYPSPLNVHTVWTADLSLASLIDGLERLEAIGETSPSITVRS